MMELFIKIVDGQPFEHPILGHNLRQAFPNIDTDNLPEAFAQFVRIEPPVIGVYEVYEGVTYEWSDGVVTDVHHLRPMTDDEKSAKQDAVKSNWAVNGYDSWTFNEQTCSFDPPVPYPNDGKSYKWSEATLSWVEIA
jgi:hypothetical protein